MRLSLKKLASVKIKKSPNLVVDASSMLHIDPFATPISLQINEKVYWEVLLISANGYRMSRSTKNIGLNRDYLIASVLL